MIITALEQIRVNHINSVMDTLYLHNADIYESLIDKEYNETRQHIQKAQKTLKDLLDSLQDEI